MSFLDSAGSDWIEEAGEEPEAEVQAEPPVEEAPADEPEPQQEEPEADATPEPQADKPTKEPVKVPYAEMRKWQKRAQEAEGKLAAGPVEVSKPQPIPDAYEQPEAFNAYQENQRQQDRFEVRAEISGFKAEQTFGKEAVEQAVSWAQEQNDPALGVRIRQSNDPVGDVVKEYQRSRTLETLAGRSFEDAARDHAIEKGWIVAEPGAVKPSSPQPSSPTPPRSLASKPGSGGVGQTANGDAFGEVFSSSGMGLKRG